VGGAAFVRGNGAARLCSLRHGGGQTPGAAFRRPHLISSLRLIAAARRCFAVKSCLRGCAACWVLGSHPAPPSRGGGGRPLHFPACWAANAAAPRGPRRHRPLAYPRTITPCRPSSSARARTPAA